MEQDMTDTQFDRASIDEETKTSRTVPRILLAEDDFEMRRMLALRLRKENYEVIECSDGYQLLDHMGNPVFEGQPDDFDLIISDIKMPGITGLEVLEGIYESEWFTPMVLITAFGDKKTHDKAEELGAAALLDKPFDIEKLLIKIKEILVLDSPRGNNWAWGTIKDEATLGLPIDIVYNNIIKSENVENLVRKEATRLIALDTKILYCRIVMIGPDSGDYSGHFHIQLMVTIPDKVFVSRSNLLSINDYQGLVKSIPIAFKVMAGRIKRYISPDSISS